MRRILVLLVWLSLVCQPSVWGQSVAEAAKHYRDFVNYRNSGQESSAYTALYESYEQYMNVLADPQQVEHYPQVRAAFSDIYPDLQEGAYYFAGQNDQQKTLQFAQAHVGISVHPEMVNENLPRNANYIMLSKLAAFNTWNAGERVKAIPYLYAYLTTGDTDRREDAFACIGRAYYQQKDFGNARRFLEEGLRAYPSNLSMLSTAINACVDMKDLDAAQPYLTQALALRPNDEGLQNVQGMVYEQHEDFEKAIEVYQKLQQAKPTSIDVARHLALNYYNAGVKAQKEGKSGRKRAEEYFRLAEPVLNDVLSADPFSVKYLCSLANVYSQLGETEKLQDTNKKLQALNVQPVEMRVTPMLIPLSGDLPLPNVPVGPTATPKRDVADNHNEVRTPSTGLISDVDIDIPVNKPDNTQTFAVIIANEDYTRVSKVDLAKNDGRTFAEYCHKVLGLPKTNIRAYENATSLTMEEALVDIKGIAEACKDQPFSILFYYAGHGIPDESTRTAYLMPVDASAQRKTGYMPLEQLYQELSSLGAQKVCVFLDACFSGAQRGGGSLAKERGVEIAANEAEAKGNMIVFSATTGSQTAMPYQEKHHGLFTYYLLKMLQETKGNATLGQLGAYIQEKVALQSQLVNRKPQNPTVKAALGLGDRWKNMKLR